MTGRYDVPAGKAARRLDIREGTERYSELITRLYNDRAQLSAGEWLEYIAIGQYLSRSFEALDSDLHQALMAGASWPQVAEAWGLNERDLRERYRSWAQGWHYLWQQMEPGKRTEHDAAWLAAALARAGGPGEAGQ